MSDIRKHSALMVLPVLVMAIVLGAPAAGAKTKTSKPTSLVGTFGIAAPKCSAGAPTAGSYFRMIQTGGTLQSGPFIPNGDSLCLDKTYTSLSPGSAGGLVTGKYQPDPTPAFDSSGGGTASAITTPTKFFGVSFAVSTNKADPQTKQATKVPTITATAKGVLAGDLDAVSVAYGGQQFNQGAPKPDDTKPGLTQLPAGSYRAKDGTYTIEWASAIVGGPFDGFTGVWHLEGTFKKAKS